MIRIAILDDESTSLSIEASSIKGILDGKKVPSEIQTFSEGEKLLESMNHTHYDLICLDVIMSPMDGTEVAKQIRDKDKKVAIIFISSNEAKVFRCFGYDPIGFIRKTNFIEDIDNAINHFLNDIYPAEQKINYLKIKAETETYLINIDEIEYVEASHNYQLIHLIGKEKPLKIRQLLSSLEKQLKPFGFIRIHKGFLVNYRTIERFGSGNVILTSQKTLPLSRANRTQIIEEYMSLTRSSLII